MDSYCFKLCAQDEQISAFKDPSKQDMEYRIKVQYMAFKRFLLDVPTYSPIHLSTLILSPTYPFTHPPTICLYAPLSTLVF
jgi:hypothetical protein